MFKETHVNRTQEASKQEYDSKYLGAMAAHLQNNSLSYKELWRAISKRPPNQKMCISKHGSLLITTDDKGYEQYRRMILSTITNSVDIMTPPNARPSVVELGCGYGRHLMALREHLKYVLIGGDLSNIGIKLGKSLSKNNRYGIEFLPFNYYERQSYSIIPEEGPTIIYTCQSIEQLPSAKEAINHLSSIISARKGTTEIIHFEPIYELHDENTVLGVLRKRYAQRHGYNQDLLSCVANECTEIIHLEYDHLGLNPLNPVSILRWR